MRAVLDSVVFVRALINNRNRCGRIIFEHSKDFVSITSPAILEEIFEVIQRSKIRAKFQATPGVQDPLEGALGLLRTATVVHPSAPLEVSRDSGDNKFFECAVAGEADCIVSEDKDILDVREYRGIKTVTCGQFLEFLT